ncbi:hypothetical protein [Clostridium butyricum]|nr:hypothetical protein [Clostridium butyricum]
MLNRIKSKNKKNVQEILKTLAGDNAIEGENVIDKSIMEKLNDKNKL